MSSSLFLVALKLWGPEVQLEGREVLIAMPCATDQLANVYGCGTCYTSKPPLSWCLREVAFAVIRARVLPATLHLSGAQNVTSDRLSWGFIGPLSLAALDHAPSKRRRPQWREPNWWRVPELVAH